MNIFFKYFLAWFPMLFLAIANGALRDLGYKKYTGAIRAHQVSTITLLILFGIFIFFVVKLIPPSSKNQALLLGAFWMALTLTFEFGFGRYRGNSWEKLLADYNVLTGHIWVLIPIALLFFPYLAFCYLNKAG